MCICSRVIKHEVLDLSMGQRIIMAVSWIEAAKEKGATSGVYVKTRNLAGDAGVGIADMRRGAVSSVGVAAGDGNRASIAGSASDETLMRTKAPCTRT
jgi:hypothetical protein